MRFAFLLLALAGCGGGGHYEQPFAPASEAHPYKPPFQVVRVFGAPVGYKVAP